MINIDSSLYHKTNNHFYYYYLKIPSQNIFPLIFLAMFLNFNPKRTKNLCVFLSTKIMLDLWYY